MVLVAVGETVSLLSPPPLPFSRCFNRDGEGGGVSKMTVSPTARCWAGGFCWVLWSVLIPGTRALLSAAWCLLSPIFQLLGILEGDPRMEGGAGDASDSQPGGSLSAAWSFLTMLTMSPRTGSDSQDGLFQAVVVEDLAAQEMLEQEVLEETMAGAEPETPAQASQIVSVMLLPVTHPETSMLLHAAVLSLAVVLATSWRPRRTAREFFFPGAPGRAKTPRLAPEAERRKDKWPLCCHR